MNKIGIIGLGRMGHAIAHRLLQSNIEVLGFDKNEVASHELEKIGGIKSDLRSIAQNADLVWLMLPVGEIIDSVIAEILPYLKPGSIIVDGGNSYFKDSIRRHKELVVKNIFYLDCGTSGGLHGETLGFSLMIGGDLDIYEQAELVFKVIAAPNGYAYTGPSGSGHYVKMIHNGIEYALLQSYAEGFELLKLGYYEGLDLEKISDVWLHGSIIRSWILNLTYDAFKQDQNFINISGKIGGGQTGNWMLKAAKEAHVDVPMLEQALKIREWSQGGGNYATKLVAMLRHEFGGHKIDFKK